VSTFCTEAGAWPNSLNLVSDYGESQPAHRTQKQTVYHTVQIQSSVERSAVLASPIVGDMDETLRSEGGRSGGLIDLPW